MAAIPGTREAALARAGRLPHSSRDAGSRRERRGAMLWQKGRSSRNVEQATGGGGGGFGIGRMRLGLGGTIIAIVIAMIFPSTRGIIFGLLTGEGDMG
jgi:hypothetical protein